MAQNSPREPRAEMRSAAAQLHELYTALVEQGFREDQALRVLGAMMAAGQQQS